LPLLKAKGYRARTLERRKSGGMDGDPPHEVFVGDIRDPEALDRAMDGVRMVVHLAARKGDQVDSYDVNVGGARNLVAAARAHGVARIVNVSTESSNFARRD